LWYGDPNAISNAVGYAKFFSRSHDAVIRVFDDTGKRVIFGNGKKETGDSRVNERIARRPKRSVFNLSADPSMGIGGCIVKFGSQSVKPFS